MLIGAVVLKIRALNKAKLPASHGRLLHAALLNIVRDRDPELSSRMHDSEINNFSNSLLRLSVAMEGMSYQIEKDDEAYWRIGVIGERLLQLLWKLPQGLVVRIGAVDFCIAAVFRSEKKNEPVSCIDTATLQQNIVNMPPVRYLTISFLAPTTFAGEHGAYPWPLPRLLFASLADRWNMFSEDTRLNVKYVKEAAEYMLPRQWEGRSCVYNIAPKRSLVSFMGTFTFDMNDLPLEYQKLFLVLAEFGAYMGIGRYTAQGMGRIVVSYANRLK